MQSLSLHVVDGVHVETSWCCCVIVMGAAAILEGHDGQGVKVARTTAFLSFAATEPMKA